LDSTRICSNYKLLRAWFNNLLNFHYGLNIANANILVRNGDDCPVIESIKTYGIGASSSGFPGSKSLTRGDKSFWK